MNKNRNRHTGRVNDITSKVMGRGERFKDSRGVLYSRGLMNPVRGNTIPEGWYPKFMIVKVR